MTDTTLKLDVLDAFRKPPRRRRQAGATPQKQPHAGWKTSALVLALARAGWGELAGADARGVRGVLTAVASHIVDHRTGAGFSSIPAVAAAAGYSHNWTQQKLWDLEAITVVSWRRGTMRRGRGKGKEKSYFQVDRRVLVELILAARVTRDRDIKAHVAESIRRLREQREKWRQRRADQRSRRSGTSPTESMPLAASRCESVAGTAPAHQHDPPDHRDPVTAAGAAAARALIRNPYGR